MRILMIEDDVTLCEMVAVHLKNAGYQVDFCHDGEDSRYYISQNAYDLILLDRMLPKIEGSVLLREFRAGGLATPVLMVTALNELGDKVDGLDAGADDYLVKPFAIEELLARVRALSRRPQAITTQQLLTCGDLSLDPVLQKLSGTLGSCELSKKESELLELFFKNPKQILPRELIFARVWGPDSFVDETNLDSYIHFVRRRLKAVGKQVQITTVRSVGYRLDCGGKV